MMSNTYHLLTVTKSHWDREWYMDYQKTRIRLVHLIDTVLDIVESDPDFVSFMLDGQTLPLEDYLEIKPENSDRLKNAIHSGKIIIGPWYILPDEMLITGEAHIRNYLLGSLEAEKFGAEKMQVGYLPDSFGHPSQMPQIIKKLGMDTIMFWRGATPQTDKNEFRWVAPDGTSVLAILMPEGYSTGCELSETPEVVARRFDEYIEKMSKRSLTNVIYLSNGGDHLEPVRYLSKLLPQVSRQMVRGDVSHTTLERFVSEVKKGIDEKKIKAYKGELWGSNTAILLGSTLSTRTYLKQLNFKASGILENYLEPMFSIAASYGMEYPKGILTRAWKYLMENQPHDSICGCSIDKVHRDMIARYNQVFEISDALNEDLAEFFSDVIDSSSVKGEYPLAVFNTFSTERSGIICATVDVDYRPTAYSDYSKYDDNGKFPIRIIDNCEEAMRPLPTNVRIYDGEKEISARLVDASVQNYLSLGYTRAPHQYNVNRLQLEFRAEDVPAMGWKIFSVVPVYDSCSEPVAEKNCIENEFFIVEACPNGTLTLTDKRNGKVLKGLNRLRDSGDCGDEYTYCPPDNDLIIEPDPASISSCVLVSDALGQTLRVSGKMLIPVESKNRSEGRAEETIECTFVSDISLYYGEEKVDIHTTFDNKAKDHRLRVLFPVGCVAVESHSSGTFSVDTRPVIPPVDEQAMEVCHTYIQKDFCDAGNDEYAVTIANRGLREYEAFNEGDETVLAVTLLRCTGVISQRWMKTRACKGGWSELAPEGQCVGEWDFDYSIIPHVGSWEDAESYFLAHEYNFPMQSLQLRKSENGTIQCNSLISSESRALVFTATKKAEHGDKFIVRMFNSTSKKVETKLHFAPCVHHVAYGNLREDSLSDANISDGSMDILADPFEIITLLLSF